MFAVLTLIVNYLYKYGFTSSNLAGYLSSGETIFKFIFGLLFFGLFMGLFLWHIGEREFRKPVKNEEQVEGSISREA